MKLDIKINSSAIIIIFSYNEMEFLSNVIEGQDDIIDSTCVADFFCFFFFFKYVNAKRKICGSY